MSFDPTLQTPKDRLRHQLGDTSGVAAQELLPDETYEAALAKFGQNEDRAVLFLAEGLYARYSQQSTSVTLISGVNVRWRDRLKAWELTIEKLKGLATNPTSRPFGMVKPSRDDDDIDGRGEYSRCRGEPWWI